MPEIILLARIGNDAAPVVHLIEWMGGPAIGKPFCDSVCRFWPVMHGERVPLCPLCIRVGDQPAKGAKGADA